MDLIVKHFNELTTTELYEILKTRSEIFVVEQDCVYQDLDDNDQDLLPHKRRACYIPIFDGTVFIQYSSSNVTSFILSELAFSFTHFEKPDKENNRNSTSS